MNLLDRLSLQFERFLKVHITQKTFGDILVDDMRPLAQGSFHTCYVVIVFELSLCMLSVKLKPNLKYVLGP